MAKFKFSVLISTVTCFLGISEAYAQVKILGPQCVKSGTEYQYIIDGSWSKESEITVCVEGGSLKASKTNCYTGKSVAYVRVIWNEGSAKRTISVKTASGTGLLSANATSSLQGGKIDSLKIRSAKSSVTPSTIRCSAAIGGGCSPLYTYQWEQSEDNLRWTEVSDANEQNLVFKQPLKRSLFYRRKVTEKSSNSIAYSDVMVTVLNPNSKAN